MGDTSGLVTIFRRHGFSDFKFIDTGQITVAQWVRMKCRFGCQEYGRNASCPPNTPEVEECRRFFREYKRAVVFHFEKKVDRPEDRFAWTREVNARLATLERDVFLSGYEKAFLLFMDSCVICGDCTGKRETCRDSRRARPGPEAMAMDVYATVRGIGYPIRVLSDYSQPMNRYAFLLID